MNIHDLRLAQVRFASRIDDVLAQRIELHNLRSDFVSYFNMDKIRTMKIDEYVIGLGSPEKGYNFCYSLERDLDGLGRLIGATAFKFGVYYAKHTDEYKFTKIHGENYKEAFRNIKKALIHLIESGEKEDINSIIGSPISPMFKGKILSTYFPDRYLNIFSEEHLDYFLTQFDLDSKKLKEPVSKREVLVNFKNQDAIMVNWSVDLFAHFLYFEYPGRPPRKEVVLEDNDDILDDYRLPNFPTNPKPTFIELEIVPFNAPVNRNKRRFNKKIDYEKEALKNKRLGDRGEKIVMDLEKERLSKANRHDLAERVKRISLESDAEGYDILSFDIDGTERLIEVKATVSSTNSTNFFYTANELRRAEIAENYYLYIVYDILSDSPKVWSVKNPFYPNNENVVMIPIKFRVTLNIKEIK